MSKERKTITAWWVPVDCIPGIMTVLQGELTDAVAEANWSYARQLIKCMDSINNDMDELVQKEEEGESA